MRDKLSFTEYSNPSTAKKGKTLKNTALNGILGVRNRSHWQIPKS
jgi:hypothetical protein